ncbi:MAG: hypothetical protein WAN71_09485 [Mycobacterium sp.]|uniref:hypothetical protein n=1 Tax=Mycobacterium sp. TaxID=1785 RepID=UPI003BAFC3C5
MRSKSTAIAAAALIALSWGAAGGLASADPPAPPPAPAPAPAPNGPKTSIDHDGTFAVGTDIVPGTYTSAGPQGNGVCYWKRLAGDDGKQLLDNAMSKKPQVVRIDPTDKTFKTDGCQPWQKDDAAVPDPGKTPEQAGLPLGILGSLLGGGAPPPKP